jgi:hypothetical protein
MTWGATGAIVGGAALNAYGTKQASDAAGDAANSTQAGQQRALDYQMEQERVPSFYREAAMKQLGTYYGVDPGAQGQQEREDAGYELEDMQRQLEKYQSHKGSKFRKRARRLQSQMGDVQARIDRLDSQNAAQPQNAGQSGQQGLIDDVMQSPFYNSMVNQGEQAVARNAAATGGFRSGTAQENLAQNSQNVLQGLVNQRLGGLQGMVNGPSNTNAIAGSMAGIGQTQGQGIMAQGQIQQGMYQNLGNLAGMGAQAYFNQPQQPAGGGYSAQGPSSNYGYPSSYGNMSMQGQDTGFKPVI